MGVKGLECAISVGLISIPCVVVKGVNVSVGNRFVDAREHGLRSDDPPGGFAVDELGVEPALLSTAHHGASSVIADLVYIVRILRCCGISGRSFEV